MIFMPAQNSQKRGIAALQKRRSETPSSSSCAIPGQKRCRWKPRICFILTLEGQKLDMAAPQRLHELREEARSAPVGNLLFSPAVDLYVRGRVRILDPKVRMVDPSKADVRDALHDQSQKASIRELNAVQRPTV